MFVLTFVFLGFSSADVIINVRDYGAVGDGITLDTDAIRAAAGAAGFGTLFFPKGNFLTGAFSLSGNTKVVLDHDAVILGSSNNEDYPLIDPLPYMGGGRVYQPLIHSSGGSNIEIIGGTIDGRGAPWWNCSRQNETLPPCNGIERPKLIGLYHGTNLSIHNTTFQNSPFWNVHISNFTNVSVSNIRVINPADSPNTDGIDIDCSQDVTVRDSFFDVGDDAVVIKSGFNYLGRKFGRESKNIIIRDVHVLNGHGISIGSDMSAGVSNVLFENIRMNGTWIGVRIKSERGRGGLVRNVTYRNISMSNVKTAIQLTLNYHDGIPLTNQSATPAFDDIRIEDVQAVNSDVGIYVDGLSDSTITNLLLSNVSIVDPRGFVGKCEFVQGICQHVYPYCPNCLIDKTELEEIYV